MPIVPVANGLYLCDFHVGYADGKVDLYGLCDSIRAPNGFPFVAAPFCVFAQLNNGLGEVPFFLDVRFTGTGELIRSTETRQLSFLTARLWCKWPTPSKAVASNARACIWWSFSARIPGCVTLRSGCSEKRGRGDGRAQ